MVQQTADRIERQAASPDTRAGTLIVGVDDSDSAQRAARYAVTLARQSGMRLVFLRVLNIGTLLGLAPEALPAVEQAEQQAAREMRGLLAERLVDSDVVWELRTASGNPYVELTAAAAREGADGIVVGASTSAGHRLMGSLPSHLVKNHQWPVTVVP